MSTGTRLTQLLSLTKAFPLPKLRQGGTLSIRSISPNIPLHVRLIPQWRDDGHIKLEQTLPPLFTKASGTSDGNNENVIYSDANEEMDLSITSTTAKGEEGLVSSGNKDETLSKLLSSSSSKWGDDVACVSVTVDQIQKLNSTDSMASSSNISSSSISSSPTFGLTNKYEEHGDDDGLSIKDRYNAITDDGKLHIITSEEEQQQQENHNNPSPKHQGKEEEKETIRHVPYHDGITHITKTNNYLNQNSRPDPTLILTAKIPEKCNVSCILSGAGGDITVNGKLEGEDGFEFITTCGGNISIGKLRGDSIRLGTTTTTTTTTTQTMDGTKKIGGGVIHVKKALEAQELNVQIGEGGRIRAKMINASNANIDVTDSSSSNHCQKLDDDDELALIDLSSVYSTQSGDGAHLTVTSPPPATTPSSSFLHTSSEEQQQEEYSNPRKVRVKSNHGHISVQTILSDTTMSLLRKERRGQEEEDTFDKSSAATAVVELGGVNGSFDVAIEKRISAGQKIVEEEKEGADDQNKTISNKPMVANIHIDSLSPGQVNILTSDVGDVGLTIDRKVESDLRLLSSPLMSELDSNILMEEDEEKVIDALEEHDNDVVDFIDHTAGAISLSRHINVQTNAFTGSKCIDMNHIEYVKGHIDNKSEEPDSRFDQKVKGLGSVGKVRIDDAASQALKGFSSSGNAGDTDPASYRPLVIAATDGDITVESLSWFGAIARRYGVQESNNPDLGRQAQLRNKKP